MIQVVTIDGPAGAGKSSVARSLAARLGWKFLDTGAMYRAVTFAALRYEVDLGSEIDLTGLVDSVQLVFEGDAITLNGEVITEEIRTPAVTGQIRYLADCLAVRERLVGWQRLFAAEAGQVVTEGRDQGSIVFPDAFRKYFLTAHDEERAHRRQRELAARGDRVSFDDVLRQVRERDAADRGRTIAPMIPAADAQIVDSTGLPLDQVVTLLEADVRAHQTLATRNSPASLPPADRPGKREAVHHG